MQMRAVAVIPPPILSTLTNNMAGNGSSSVTAPTPTTISTTTIFITTTIPTSTIPPDPGLTSRDKAVIAGASIGAFLVCLCIFWLFWWFCSEKNRPQNNPQRPAPTGIVGITAAGATSSTTEKRSLGSRLFARSSKGDKNANEGASNLRPGPQPFQGDSEEHYTASLDGTTPPAGIPVVRPSFAAQSGGSSSSPGLKLAGRFKRSSSGGPELKPAPYQYGVVGSVGSRRGSTVMTMVGQQQQQRLGMTSAPSSPTSAAFIVPTAAEIATTSMTVPVSISPIPEQNLSPPLNPLELESEITEGLGALIGGLEPYVYDGTYC
ncbi:uncharacterized protein EI90DRAFT_3061507 [Cantharellus anzutake]|uniref:uncharacterized protein n=1 Tax=Cantharellus anzutake TaxID=1750568 RepID=UPI001906C36E|nr:uncharacterized protein EI90DRAFT_3061507 [Cantharellus anzutake]KAF8330079.1 hypothetical protein EI90DRAFT_3061507 [Cantharellus anzutake]